MDLSYNQLAGPMHARFLKATLRILNFEHNQIGGSIPPELGGCYLLEFLDLSNNQLTGIVPQNLTNLTSLTHLDLSYNLLVGEIPVDLDELQQLTYLDLSHNGLSGTVPLELGSLPHLRSLYLRANVLAGEIPIFTAAGSSPLVQTAQALEELDLGFNRLNGTIPTQLGTLASLRTLILHRNSLSGSIPPSLASLTLLRRLYLRFNYISGTLPAGLQAPNPLGLCTPPFGTPNAKEPMALPYAYDAACIQPVGVVEDMPPSPTACVGGLSVVNADPGSPTCSGVTGSVCAYTCAAGFASDGRLHTCQANGHFAGGGCMEVGSPCTALQTSTCGGRLCTVVGGDPKC